METSRVITDPLGILALIPNEESPAAAVRTALTNLLIVQRNYRDGAYDTLDPVDRAEARLRAGLDALETDFLVVRRALQEIALALVRLLVAERGVEAISGESDRMTAAAQAQGKALAEVGDLGGILARHAVAVAEQNFARHCLLNLLVRIFTPGLLTKDGEPVKA